MVGWPAIELEIRWASCVVFGRLVMKKLNPFRVVLGSPVRSGLLTPKGVDRDRDRSSKFEKWQKTGPNRCKPVQCGLYAVFCGLETGPS